MVTYLTYERASIITTSNICFFTLWLNGPRIILTWLHKPFHNNQLKYKIIHHEND